MLLRLQEINVSGGDDSHQLAAHFAIICDGDSTESVASLGLEDVTHQLVGTHHDGVCNEALFVSLGDGGRDGGEVTYWRSSGVEQQEI